MLKIKVKLNSKSIDSAIRQLEEYKNSLPVKLEKLRKRIARELVADIATGFNGSIYDDVLNEGMKVPNVEVYSEENGEITVVFAKGKEAVFAEFGAGVYYNPGGGAHPNRPAGIVAIGEYGKGYGKRKVWGYYDENGELKLTHGTPASMPMYHAVQRIVPRIPKLAKEIFGGGGS